LRIFLYDYLQGDRLFIEVMAAIAWMLSRAIETRLAEEAVRDLTRRFLGLQDEERRRLAGELHDTTAQNMASLVMDLGALNKEADVFSPTARERLSQCENLARQSLQEIRTFSHQLYPPMLDELGLRSALGVFTEGFSERSGLRVDLELAQLQRLPKDFEIAIFRIVQEGLTNVHRHSNGSFARVAIKFKGNTIQVRVEDDGTTTPNRDIPEAPKARVGLANMRAWVKQFGGEVRLNSHHTGTVLQATLPLTEAARAASA
jgi:two-component system NarL family sensor kinase